MVLSPALTVTGILQIKARFLAEIFCIGVSGSMVWCVNLCKHIYLYIQIQIAFTFHQPMRNKSLLRLLRNKGTKMYA